MLPDNSTPEALAVLAGDDAKTAIDDARRVAGDRPELKVSADLDALVKSTWDLVLRSQSAASRLYRSADANMILGVREGDASPEIQSLGTDLLRLELAKRIRFTRPNRKTERDDDTYPPDVLVKSLLAAPARDLPTLERVVTAPVVGPDGDILTAPGYHRASRTIYQPQPGFRLGTIPEHPTPADVAAALGLLTTPIAEFPFTGPSERAHTIAAMLLPFARELVDGPTPLHLIRKPAPGTGASLLCDIIATVATGAPAPAGVEPRDDDELRKRLTAEFIKGAPIVLLDNVSRLRFPSLAAALTAPTFNDRILGSTRTVAVPVRCLWLATGNNPRASNEIARRIIRIGLDARTERPWERDGFRITNPRTWTTERRGELVAAILTIIRAWVQAGRPDGTRTLGSYEAWARVIGGILHFARVPGFLENTDDFYEEADEEGTADRAFVSAWSEAHGTGEVAAADLYPLAKDILDLGTGDERSQRTRLGRTHLPRMKGRIVAGWCIDRARSYGNAARWRLTAPPPAPEGCGTWNVDDSTFHAEQPETPHVLNVWKVTSTPDGCDRAGVCAGDRASGSGCNLPHLPQPPVTPADGQENHPWKVALNVATDVPMTPAEAAVADYFARKAAADATDAPRKPEEVSNAT